MRFGSVCSGIEAASVAWHPLGWRAAWLAEIEPFPAAVLKHHYPSVPNLGDMTALPDRIASGEVEAPDLFCGGTPCQAFSVAGLRKSLDDARGNLSLTFCEIANAIDHVRVARGDQPCIVFWENVPGVLSTKDNAFGCFLAGLAGEDEPLEPPGGKWSNAGAVFGPSRAVAWRILDAQYFGVAQRRRRVFVVASSRDGFDPAAVLFEFDGVRRDIAPRRGAGEATAGGAAAGAGVGGADRSGVSIYIKGAAIGRKPEAGPQYGEHLEELAYTQNCVDVHGVLAPVAFTQNSRSEVRQIGGDGGVVGALAADAGAQQQNYVAFHPTQDPISSADGTTHAMGCGSSQGCATVAVAAPMTFDWQAGGGGADQSFRGKSRAYITDPPERTRALTSCKTLAVQTAMQVRRLTPTECERLQGFPDGYTAIPWRGKPADQCPDGPRYKALGNSWAVPVVRWIGERINILTNIV